ncbi:hypothetical protein HELRODRAFT_169037 [Helobdella robusta]|uniref:PHD-type domain-containing protein n=1 Tax=Helobdella robusta TaxID=6412 RepID=T1F1A5_HELRO|nr:hypothetical protein HELRODRAFT_169037 [Helobdella robusta]ESO09096.1 hypothetical protein HELRODRAFT_169037 [Helobdella robusta]
MSTKCVKCIVVKTKDGVNQTVKCYHCEYLFHAKCVNIDEEIVSILNSENSIKWFCEKCLKAKDNTKELTQLETIKTMITKNDDNLTVLEKQDIKMVDEICNLKSDLKASWANIVEKKHYEKSSEIKEGERNLVIFNLPEKENQNDRELMMKIFKHISKDMSDNGIEKVFRLGKKNESVIRPVLIKLDSLGTKGDLLKHASKIMSLKDNLKNIRLCNDLTREQRSELKNLVTDAKAKEAACQRGFLYRVRGTVGRCKIIKFMKGTEN